MKQNRYQINVTNDKRNFDSKVEHSLKKGHRLVKQGEDKTPFGIKHWAVMEFIKSRTLEGENLNE